MQMIGQRCITMGINSKDLLELVCVPACRKLNMLSLNALGLMMGTGAIESALGGALIQRTSQGNVVAGGGLGWPQMQESAHDDCWKNVINPNDSLMKAFTTINRAWAHARVLVYDLQYAAMMCRVQYSRFSEALPLFTDAEAVYNYYKKYWNTGSGASTLEKWMAVYPPIIVLLNQTDLKSYQ